MDHREHALRKQDERAKRVGHASTRCKFDGGGSVGESGQEV